MNLRNDMRQKNTQMNRDFHSALTGEARPARGEATESLPTAHAPESPASTHQLREEVWEQENLKQALQQVKANKGSPGIDGMTVEELPGYLQQHWPSIRQQLLKGTYKPKPVRRVEIEKPDGGGMRKLGIPSVLDRWVRQAVLQVLQRQWDPTFSDHSYGFRPGRSAHQAVAKAQ
jgi:RNA-directed DNA polymerase